jgi:hypothetical protein
MNFVHLVTSAIDHPQNGGGFRCEGASLVNEKNR